MKGRTEVGRKRQNESFYQYRANCSVRKEDGTEEIKKIGFDTDIPFGKLYFWNKLYHLRKCQKRIYDIAIQDDQIVKCKILQEELILIPNFTYKSEQIQVMGWMDIRKIFIILEMILLVFLSMIWSSLR